jgi:hypothetical protein
MTLDPIAANPLYEPVMFTVTFVLGAASLILAWFNGGDGGKSA